jgi:hypothetical protein
MSTSPDEVMNTLSWYIAGRVGVDEVEAALANSSDLGPESTELVRELRGELADPDASRSTLQPLLRETIEAIAHGD